LCAASAPVATTDATTIQTAAIRRLIVNMVTSQRAPDVCYNVRAPFWFIPQRLVTLLTLPSRRDCALRYGQQNDRDQFGCDQVRLPVPTCRSTQRAVSRRSIRRRFVAASSR